MMGLHMQDCRSGASVWGDLPATCQCQESLCQYETKPDGAETQQTQSGKSLCDECLVFRCDFCILNYCTPGLCVSWQEIGMQDVPGAPYSAVNSLALAKSRSMMLRLLLVLGASWKPICSTFRFNWLLSFINNVMPSCSVFVVGWALN